MTTLQPGVRNAFGQGNYAYLGMPQQPTVVPLQTQPQPPAPQQSFLGYMPTQQAMGDNRMALLGLAQGLMQGRGARRGMEAGTRGFMGGARQDQRNAIIGDQRADRQRRLDQEQALMTTAGGMPGPWAALGAQNRTVAGSMVSSAMAPPTTAKDAYGRLRYLSGPNKGGFAFGDMQDPTGRRPLTNETLTAEGQLRREATSQKEVKQFREMDMAIRKVADSAGLGTAAGDMSLVFGYMKLLDPGSTVREGEQAQAAQTRGIPQSIVALYNKALTGETLDPTQRNEFVKAAVTIYQGQRTGYEGQVNRYRGLAKGGGFDPDRVAKAIPAWERPVGTPNNPNDPWSQFD